MNENKLIAQALLEISKRAETEFIEVSEDNKEIIEAAKKIGITLPSPDLAVFKTTYCEIDKVNRNGVILPRKAVEAGLHTLIGKQCNWEHEGKGTICGYTIKAEIKEDRVETINVLFKSLFSEQIQELKDKMKSREAAVSFEIWNRDEQGNSVVKVLENGTREISPIIFHGTGVLLSHKPACPTAKIFKLIATRLTDSAEEFINKVFSPDLVYASLALEDNLEEENYDCECLKCGKIVSSDKHCRDIKCPECGGEMRRKDRPGIGQPQISNSDKKEENKLDEVYLLELAENQVIELTDVEISSFENDYEDSDFEEAKRLTYEQRKNLPDEAFALVVTVKNKVTGEPRKIRMFVINDEAHVRNALARLGQIKVQETLKKLGVSIESIKNKILKKAKELDMKDLLERQEKSEEHKEELSQETPEPAQVTDPAPEQKSEEQKPEEQAQVEEQPVEPKKLLKIVTEESIIVTEIPEESGMKVEKKGKKKRTCSYSDGTDETSTEDFEVIDTFSTTQVEEKIGAAIEELIAALPKEVTDCVKAKVKDGTKPADAIKECWKEYKDKQAAVMAEEIGKKEKEIQNIKEELGKKDQEIAKLNPNPDPEKDKNLEIGNTTTNGDDELDKQKKEINKIISSKHNQ